MIALSKLLSRIHFDPGKPKNFARRLEDAIILKATREVHYAEPIRFRAIPFLNR
jgi:hypothetical protein